VTPRPAPCTHRVPIPQTPVSYILFDLTHLDGEPTTDLPYTQRRTMLASLGINHPSLLVPPHQLDVAPANLLELAKAHHIEGIVGKRLDSPYRPGRSPAWLKHPLRQRIEVVVGGWTPGQGNRTNNLGAFFLGLPGPHTTADGQGLVFVGAVGTGWTQATATRLFRHLGELARDTRPNPSRGSTHVTHAGSDPPSSATSNTAPSRPRAT
jgi:bifunctional non-homologous end joining protein LigD